MDGLTLRRGSAADLRAVFRLNRVVFDEAWSLASLHAALESGFDLLLCEDNGLLAGYLLSQDILDEVHIMQIAVAAAYRRRGIATRLTRALLRDKAAMSRMLLEVRASNTAARSLYVRLGFREDGRRPAYYAPDADGFREDAVLMSMSVR